MPSLYSLKQQIVETGKRMYQRGMVAANDGNLSIRVDDNRILLTPSGMSKGFMQVSDLVLVDLSGTVISGDKKPTSEMGLHLTVYEERPQIQAVCHAHPPYATAFSVVGKSLDSCILSEMITVLGSVPLVPYATPGSPQLPEAIRPFVAQYDAFLLQNHGALTVGKDLTDAYHKMETLEHSAHVYFVSQLLGSPHVLDEEQLKDLLEQREKFDIETAAVCKPAPAATPKNNISEKELEKIIQQIVNRLKE